MHSASAPPSCIPTVAARFCCARPTRASAPASSSTSSRRPNDLPTLREGFRRGREIAAQKAMDKFRGEEVSPGADVKSDAEIDAFIRKTMITVHHPASTCPIGLGPEAVLDPQLRVRGVDRLRVVDASAMPDLVTAHINACVLMMAERAADLIAGKPALAAAA